MKNKFNALENYTTTMKRIGYVPRKDATQETYNHIGFMSGLEVHQQLKTKEKLFCHCPAGIFKKNDEYDAEIVRHMRPTLSELGEYDGTALMEFKTKKEIIYRLANENTCTYEIDDTPPFPVNKEALNIAIEISLLSKLNIVGEVHITRKQYLDGSIPTGFQRTAIIGVEGEIQLRNKKIRLIQLSLEEDSCREISDIGHVRVYKTDRLGMPLIETVTYPDMTNPMEVMEACNYIRFLNRSTGKVRTGMGAGRQDVNVSCKGGTRVEIKGVAHTKWIPELTHNEAFRQWALLQARNILLERVQNASEWSLTSKNIEIRNPQFDFLTRVREISKDYEILAVNLPSFEGIISHFTQPGKTFFDELSDRLKVIACIEKPNLFSSEDLRPILSDSDLDKLQKLLTSKEGDAQLVIFGPKADMETALETVEERCRMAFEGIPPETRKSFKDGTTIFERVLPGADRMYPDTDSPPIPLNPKKVEKIKEHLPSDISKRYEQLKKWGIPEDTYTYIFSKNLYPVMKAIIEELGVKSSFVGTTFGHNLKFIEGHAHTTNIFNYDRIYELFKFLQDNTIDYELIKQMLPLVYDHPGMDFPSVLTLIKFKRFSKEDILSRIPILKEKYEEIQLYDNIEGKINWIMGGLRKVAVGNISFVELKKLVREKVSKK